MTNEEKLSNLISDVLQEQYSLKLDTIPIEVPRNTDFGDYASTICMQLAKQLRRAPRQIAEELAKVLKEKSDVLESVEVAGPGYLNFRIKKTSLAAIVNKVLAQGKKYGENYMTPIIANSSHEYPFYKKQKRELYSQMGIKI